MSALAAWLSALAFTLAVEAPFALWALRESPRHRAWAPWLSLLTHPVVYFGFPALWPGDYWAQTLAAEAFAVCVEGSLLRWMGAPRGFAWAFAANTASAGLGLLSRAWLGWP